MSYKSALSGLILVFVLLCASYFASVARLSTEMLVVQALSGSQWPVREVATRILRLRTECGEDDFLPSSPIGFVVAAWEDDQLTPRYEKLIDSLIALGCDINATGERGLTGLHSAVLFNNPQAVTSLLLRGADKNRFIVVPGSDGNSEIPLDVLQFANYLNNEPDGVRNGVIEALEFDAQ